MYLKKIYHTMIPQTIRNKWGVIRIKERMHAEIKRGRLEKYRDEIDHLLSKKLCAAPVFPYSYIDRYQKMEVVVKIDGKYGLPYVYHKHKKLFFPRNMDIQEVIKLYRGLMAEQDEHSPHHYFSDLNRPQKDNILVDVGSAEGIIALDYVDKVSKIYLIESEPLWNEALEATFAGYKNVEIISAYIGDETTGGTPLSKAIKERSGLVIKMDIEGNELNALAGMKDVLCNIGNKYAICTYHRYEDAKRIASIFEKNKIQFEFSEGYMFMPSGSRYEFPHLRHGVIRGVRFQ